jgi:hypothetical protein
MDWFELFADTGFVAAIIGAIVGTVGSGVISWLLQKQQFAQENKLRSEEALERKQALAATMLFKFIHLHGTAAAIKSHFSHSRRIVGPKADQLEPWQYVIEFANFPDKVRFTDEEKTNLFRLKSNELFDSVADFDAGVIAAIDIASKYSESRARLSASTMPDLMEGNVSSGQLNKEDWLKLKPLMVVTNQLAVDLEKMVGDLEKEGFENLSKLAELFRNKLAMTVDISRKSPEDR